MKSDMVVGDKNMEETRNGKRSRGPSPNGHLSDDSSATDDSDHDSGMRIGLEYQTAIPSYNPDSKPESRMEAMLVWAPHPDLPECKVDEYISIAKEKHGYNTEQALGMLFWHKHNVDKALSDLANFTPFPDEWTVEDKVLFEQAFSFHGKSFHRIRQMLPDKSIASLVKYYYSWKKTRSRTSLMDRQARKLASQREDSEEEREGSGNSDSDFEHSQENGKESENKNSTTRPGPKSSQLQGKHNLKNKRRPPKGMHLNYEDLIAIATGPPGQGDAILRALDEELVALKRQVQNNKQIISMQKHKTSPGIEPNRIAESSQRINARWTHDELLLAVQGVRKYGKNFKAIAETIGNKTDTHIRSFFANYRRRYNLDEVLAEFEKENGTIEIKEEEEPMETDAPPEATNNDTTPSSSQEEQKSAGVGAPPPLLKQPPNNNKSNPTPIRQPPLQLPQGRITGAGSRVIHQPPPPLVRPVVPVMGHIAGHKQQPPQLTSRD